MTTYADMLYQLGGVPVGLCGMGKAMPQKTYFVDGRNGSNGNNGSSPDTAFLTIQKAINIVNVVDNLYIDVDIVVMGGYYQETLRLKSDHLSGTENLWTNGGSNVAGIGKIRVIAHGVVFLEGGTSAVVPTITIERCNVEFHDFEMIYMTTSETITSGNWTLPSGGSVSGYGMPCVYVGDDWNNDTLLYAASNNILFKNCRINGGGKSGGSVFMNHGAKHIFLVNCIIEYGHTYGAAFIGSSKGSGAECHILECLFSQNGTDIYQQAQITNTIQRCLFINDQATKHLAGGSGNSLNWIDNCAGLSENLFEAAGSSGWDATRISTSTDGGEAGSANLTTDTWRAGLTSTHGTTS